MKAKIRAHNLPDKRKDALDKAAREYILKHLQETDDGVKTTYNRRITLGLCLVLNDQYNFGAKRIWKAVMGLGEILNGICDEVYRPREMYGPEDPDKVADAMMLELADRGIYVQIEGDPLYGNEEYMKKLLGDKYKPPLDMDGRKRKSPAAEQADGRSKKMRRGSHK